MHYATKGEVNSVNQICNWYPVSRITTWWLMIFSSDYVIGSVNALVLLKGNKHDRVRGIIMQRGRKILHNLSFSLFESCINTKAKMFSLPSGIRILAQCSDDDTIEDQALNRNRDKCVICGWVTKTTTPQNSGIRSIDNSLSNIMINIIITVSHDNDDAAY